MKEKFLTLSEDYNPNYVASIHYLGELYPIERADKLKRTVVNGFDIVVDASMKKGDMVVYFPYESIICRKMLGSNNLYDLDNCIYNDNYNEVKKLLDEGKKYEARKLCGFFSGKGRVKCIRIRSCTSQGFVIPANSLEKMCPQLSGTDWELYNNCEFDTVCGEKICWKNVIPGQTPVHRKDHNEKRQKRLRKLKRIIENQFVFHYDTRQLNYCFNEFHPDDRVTITVKVHGVSAIFANVLCNRKLSLREKIKKLLGKKVDEVEYGNVYSSRSVVKNKEINPEASNYYGIDIWKPVNEMLLPFLDNGMTVYGEIVGYVDGTDVFVQKNHDYGCKPGQWKFMPYRITNTYLSGEKYEWSVAEVDEWTHKIVELHPEISDRIMFLTILYNGRLGDLYPDVPENCHWHEEVLARMKVEPRFMMEEREVMCKYGWDEYEKLCATYEKIKDDPSYTDSQKEEAKNEKETFFNYTLAPREGIVIRKNNDKISEAWKLKTSAHALIAGVMKDNDEIDLEEVEEQKG